VARAWEAALAEPNLPHTRKVALRSAIALSPDAGGAFNKLLTLARWGLGGRAGHGRQFVSWIHDQDFVRAIFWLIDRDDIEGVVNVAAPEPLPNADFMRALREAAGIRVGLPATRWMLETGAFFLRTETELLLKSRRVVPRRLLEQGFAFNFPLWPDAARDLCRRSIATKQP
jgi:NAD dependent epimerase/dehydratase family enzyme